MLYNCTNDKTNSYWMIFFVDLLFFFFFVPPVSVLREINFKYNKFIIFIRVIILKLKCINHSNSKIVINLAKKKKKKEEEECKEKREKKKVKMSFTASKSGIVSKWFIDFRTCNFTPSSIIMISIHLLCLFLS